MGRTRNEAATHQDLFWLEKRRHLPTRLARLRFFDFSSSTGDQTFFQTGCVLVLQVLS